MPRCPITLRGEATAADASPPEHRCEVPVALGFRSRLLGLALLDRAASGPGLLIHHCSAIHTFGMRFALDLVFLDADGRPLAVHLDVPRRRFVRCPGAFAVLEMPAGSLLGAPR